MADFLTGLPLFAVALTFGTFQIGLWCQKKTKFALCNPILISALLVIGVLLLTKIDPKVYDAQMDSISWLLTPMTVSLAVPLYQQIKVLKKNLPAVFTGVLAGTLVSLLTVLGMCIFFRLDRQFTVSLLPKNITSAIGMAIAEENGGNSTLAFISIFITGILGNLAGPFLCRLLKITDQISMGAAYGTASHLVGTARATEEGTLCGAVSSLSLVAAGICTALLFPLICSFL